MPQRFLRPGLRHSSRWNSVSFDAQSLYIRILTLVDDYGRHDGRASVLWGECFAVWNELHPKQSITLAATGELLQQLAAACMVEIYDAGEPVKRVLQISQWEERVRDGSKEKWPKNPNPQQPAAVRSNPLPPTPPPSPASTPPPVPAELDCPEFIQAWEAWKKFRTEIKKKLAPSTQDQQLKKLSKVGHKHAIAMISKSIEKGWTGLFEIEEFGTPNGSEKPKRDLDVWHLCGGKYNLTTPPLREHFPDEKSFGSHVDMYDSWKQNRLRQKESK